MTAKRITKRQQGREESAKRMAERLICAVERGGDKKEISGILFVLFYLRNSNLKIKPIANCFAFREKETDSNSVKILIYFRSNSRIKEKATLSVTRSGDFTLRSGGITVRL